MSDQGREALSQVTGIRRMYVSVFFPACAKLTCLAAEAARTEVEARTEEEWDIRRIQDRHTER